jgi:lipopolysaccharide transport system permease protein
MRTFRANLLEMFASLSRNRELIIASTKRDVQGRYRGSFFGLLWSFFNPLFLLMVYTFVFSVIFQARWGGGTDSKTEFALLLFAGLLIFNLFAECINRAPGWILSNTNYVTKIVFPLEIIPFVGLLSALFQTLISLFVWLIAYIIFFGMPHFTVLYLPLVLVPFCLFLMGLGWALASLGVFLRDVSQITGMITTALMFLSPIFYPVSSFPETYRYLLYLNPLTPVVEQTRDVLFWGISPNFLMLGVYWLVTVCIAWMGFALFQKTRKGFADVL